MKTLPTTLLGNIENSNEVYFRLYRREDKLITVVTMQSFDEYDYHEKRFVRDKEGNKYYFLEEDHAIQQLNVWFDNKDIDPEYAMSSGLIR
jgi:hypothetical protein